jgi:hypothetical protein
LWEDGDVDPVLLMCLVIPQADLIQNTSFGAALISKVETVLGEDKGQYSHVVKEFGNVLESMRSSLQFPRSMYSGNEVQMAIGFKKNEVLQAVRAGRRWSAPRRWHSL